MEDSHIVELDLGGGVSFFGVYDGHGGNEVADFVRDHLINELKNLASFKAGEYEHALKDVYLKMDDMLKTSYGKSKLVSYKKGAESGTSFMGR